MQKVRFYTLGCKVNQYETQALREEFISSGWQEVEDGLPAERYVINTCTVTRRADSRSLWLIRQARRKNPRAEILVTGCLVESDQEKIKKADNNCIILGNDFKNKLRGISYFKGRTRAFLKIQDGCDNFCSYCKVPLVRSILASKKKEEVANEAKRLAENGYQEIVLTGICIGSYGKDLPGNVSLGQLLGEIESISAIKRIRISSIEPQYVNDELIAVIRSSKKICPHLHIPLQSGDNQVLKRMNRGYIREEYLGLVNKLKQAITNISISTDCIAGFPGETQRQFANTVDLVKVIEPLKVHIFPYSRRQGTAACARLKKDELSSSVIRSRAKALEAASLEASAAFKQGFLGRVMPVLIEGRQKANPDFWEGFTGNYIRVKVESGLDLSNLLISLKLKKLEKDGTIICKKICKLA